MAYERITVVGNIGSVEFLQSALGNPYCRITVAVNRESKASHKNKSDNTMWYQVLLFGGMVKDKERLMTNYYPGRQVLVEGRPQVEAFQRNDGSLGIDNTIIAISMPELLDSRRAK